MTNTVIFPSNVYRPLTGATLQKVIMWRPIYMHAIVLILSTWSVTIPHTICTVHYLIAKITLLSDITRSSESDGRSDVTVSLECPDKLRVP